MGFDGDRSFNSIRVDSEMSTNGLMYILENGTASNEFIIDEENTKVFKRELTMDLAKLVAKVRQGWQLLLKKTSFL